MESFTGGCGLKGSESGRAYTRFGFECSAADGLFLFELRLRVLGILKPKKGREFSASFGVRIFCSPSFMAGYRFGFLSTFLFKFNLSFSPGLVQAGGITANKIEEQEKLGKGRWEIPFDGEIVRY